MTKSELIKALEQFDDNIQIVVNGYVNGYENGYDDIQSITQIKIKEVDKYVWYNGKYEDNPNGVATVLLSR